MRQHEAETEAAKRNAHKNPALVDKEWRAVFVAEKQAWLPRLVDNQWALARKKQDEAHQALRRGDLNSFYDAAGDALMARVRAAIADGEGAGHG